METAGAEGGCVSEQTCALDGSKVKEETAERFVPVATRDSRAPSTLETVDVAITFSSTFSVNKAAEAFSSPLALYCLTRCSSLSSWDGLFRL